MREQKIKDIIFWCLAFIFSLIEAYFVYRFTKFGVGLVPDSIAYITGARNILENKSLAGLNTLWPPLYPLLITAGGFFAGEVLVAARWLQICVIILNTILFGYIIYRETRSSLFFTLLGWLLLISSYRIIWFHSIVLSGASFTLLALAGLYFLSLYIQANEKYFYLIIGSLFVGLAFLDRYIGGALIVTGIFSILLFSNVNIRRKIIDCAIFSFISSFFIAFWQTYLFATQRSMNRHINYELIHIKKLYNGVETLLDIFYIPNGYEYILIALVILPGIFYFFSCKRGLKVDNIFAEISFLFIPIYLFLVIVVISFVDFSVNLDIRMLLPPTLFYIIGLLLVISRFLAGLTVKNIYKILTVLFVATLLVHPFLDKIHKVNYWTENGYGYANKEWSRSDIMSWIRKSPKNKTIYTNGPEPIKLYLHDSSKMIPRHTFPRTRKYNYKIMNELENMVSDLDENDGLIVYFSAITWRWYLPTAEQLEQVLPVRRVYEGKDGVVLEVTRMEMQ